MPNKYGQVTTKDCKAPKGQFRIMQEHMSDGDLEIVGDFYRQATAEKITKGLREHNQEDVFILYNDQGEEVT